MTDRRWRLIATVMVTAIIVLVVSGSAVVLAALEIYAAIRGRK